MVLNDSLSGTTLMINDIFPLRRSGLARSRLSYNPTGQKVELKAINIALSLCDNSG